LISDEGRQEKISTCQNEKYFQIFFSNEKEVMHARLPTLITFLFDRVAHGNEYTSKLVLRW
jgi:hypothetical protein